MKPNAVAVLDVGKTNKKASLYDRQLHILGEDRRQVPPREIDGLEVDDTDTLLAWFRDALKRLAGLAEIRAIAITTHGATVALLDGEGRLAHPSVSYSAAKGSEVQEAFYAEFGSREALHRVTGTPDVGFANMAKVLYYLKTRRPDAWATARHALFFTGYLGHELTGAYGMEPTYAGNHCYLWDFTRNAWSDVALKLGADVLFPKTFGQAWDCLGIVKPEWAADCGIPADCKVTFGIHDSNANYLPYLARGYDDFLLNSTGTWCVLMRPSPTAELSDDEIRAKVLFNMDVFGRPVRTCIFPAGMEYDTFRAFTDHADRTSVDDVRRVVAEKRLFVIPGVLPDASAFPGAKPRVVNGSQEHPIEMLKAAPDKPMTPLGQAYYAALNLSLALATRKMLSWCAVKPGTTIFIEGGFAKNTAYCELLATLCPEQRFVLTNVQEGTSFGAALTGWMCAEGLSLESIGSEFDIETTPIARRDYGNLDAYQDAFQALL